MGVLQAHRLSKDHTRPMPSSPITDTIAQPDRTDRLLELLVRVPDPRDPRGVRYTLSGMLAVAVAAVLTGARSFAAIGEWAVALSSQQLSRLGLGAAPEESTLRKLFARLDADALDARNPDRALTCLLTC